MNRKLIIALIIIVLIVLAGIIVFSHGNAKSDTQITFLSGNAVTYGSQIEFELKDSQGNALPNQNVTISFGANGEMQDYSVVTDSEGKGALQLNDEYGTYNITVTFNGNEKYNNCSASQTINVGDVSSESSNDYSSSETESSSDSSSSSSSDLNYDSELNVYYDSNGKIVGGQNDGASYDYIKNNPPEVDEDGNLV